VINFFDKMFENNLIIDSIRLKNENNANELLNMIECCICLKILKDPVRCGVCE
jgi:lipoprotein signal peptidase